MKHIINIVFILLSVFLVIYLLGSFSQASFDISQWTEHARGITAVFIGLCMFLCLMIYGMDSIR
jgi:hypothetical protein